MFWVKQYCKVYNLTIQGRKIINENNKAIGEIDFYEETVKFEKTYLFRHLAEASVLKCKLHGETYESEI